MIAKERAFLPHGGRGGTSYATSAFMIGKLRAGDIWLLGRHKLAGVEVRGRADLSAERVTGVGLRLNADSRFRRHVDIVGWADDKAGRKLQAQKLAHLSRVHLAPQA